MRFQREKAETNFQNAGAFVSPTYAEKLKDPRWQRLRLQIFERDKWTCRKCRNTRRSLAVHHTYYAEGLDPWDYPPKSLKTLCEDCHRIEPSTRSLRRKLEQRDTPEPVANSRPNVALTLEEEEIRLSTYVPPRSDRMDAWLVELYGQCETVLGGRRCIRCRGHANGHRFMYAVINENRKPACKTCGDDGVAWSKEAQEMFACPHCNPDGTVPDAWRFAFRRSAR
jgi:hypothetical protein